MAGIAQQLKIGAVYSDILSVCPQGTKMWIMNVGYLEVDAGWFLRAGNTSTLSNTKSPERERRALVMYCVLIEHPTEGLILWETGCGKDYPEVWGPEISDIFPRVKYEPEHELPAAIAKTGHNIKDVKQVIIGHLHLDHAGGLENFRGTDVPVLVHDEELRHAFWAYATGCDRGAYLAHYLTFDINWKTFTGQSIDFGPGLLLHHLPGHTPGLIGLQINLANDGTFLFISDHCHVKENYESGIPQGWLARDHIAWFQSTQYLKRLERRTKGRVVPGHDIDILDAIWKEKTIWT